MTPTFCLSQLFWARLPSHPTRAESSTANSCILLGRGATSRLRWWRPTAKGWGRGSLRGDLEEMETWRPDPATLAAGPCSLLLDGSACLLEAWGQVGIRTGSCKDRRIICCFTGPHTWRRLLSKEDKPFPGSPPGLDAKMNRQGQEITFAVCLLPCAF